MARTAVAKPPHLFSIPNAEVNVAVDSENKVAALRSATFEYESKAADLERKFAEAMQALRDQYIEAVRLIHEEDN